MGVNSKYNIPRDTKKLPSRELTYPPDKAYLKMIFLFPRWDMLISGSVIILEERERFSKAHQFWYLYMSNFGGWYNQQMGVFSSFSPVAQILVNRKGGSSGSVSWSQRGIFQDGSSIETWIKTIGSWMAWDLLVYQKATQFYDVNVFFCFRNPKFLLSKKSGQ